MTFSPLPSPPLDPKISFHQQGNQYFFSTLRHNARGVRCRNVGEIGINFAPAALVNGKNAHGPRYGKYNATTERTTSAAAVFKQQSTLKMMTVEAVVAISLRGRQTADNTGRGKEGVVRRQ